jgi:hypothetical protein
MRPGRRWRDPRAVIARFEVRAHMVARYAFTTLAWLFLACVVVQVFLAGMGVFAGSANFETHRGFGYLFGWLTLLMLVVALVGRLGRRWAGFAGVLLVLFALQSVFIAFRGSVPAAAALHPVNALAIFWVAQHVARGSLSLVRGRGGVVAATVGARP